jgi:hypothetical protein
VSNIGIIFSNLFNADEKLDIMFLTSEDEMRLGEVCGPFYLQATSGPNDIGLRRRAAAETEAVSFSRGSVALDQIGQSREGDPDEAVQRQLVFL